MWTTTTTTTTKPSSRTWMLVGAVLLSTCATASAWQPHYSPYRQRYAPSSCQSFTSFKTAQSRHRQRMLRAVPESEEDTETVTPPTQKSSYNLGINKNRGLHPDDTNNDPGGFWMAPDPVDKHQDDANANNGYTDIDTPVVRANKSKSANSTVDADSMMMTNRQQGEIVPRHPKTTRRMVARDNDSQLLRGAMWDETHYESETEQETTSSASPNGSYGNRMEAPADGGRPHSQASSNCPPRPYRFYPDIDMSIPESVYSEDGSVDLVWDLLRWDAYQEAQREPLLVSFLYSTILNHRSLESSLAFLLANRLQSPGMMISTQLQSIILDSLDCPVFRRSLRADMMAVRDRDPACNCLPDVFLYFKGFHALQSHRVAHCLWNSGKYVLAQFLQSQVSQVFQIDIHPNATMGRYVMLLLISDPFVTLMDPFSLTVLVGSVRPCVVLVHVCFSHLHTLLSVLYLFHHCQSPLVASCWITVPAL
jgi:hypothetical protein